MSANGYHGRILHIDLTREARAIEEPDEVFYRIYAGGGLLGTYYLLKGNGAGYRSPGTDNLLIFANSVIAGYPAAGWFATW